MRMPLPGDRGAETLLTALLLGAALGAFYALLRPLRRRARRAAALLDVLFALSAGFLAFLFAMSEADGRPGLWELAAMLLGFLLFLYFLCRFKQVLSCFLSWIRAKKEN